MNIPTMSTTTKLTKVILLSTAIVVSIASTPSSSPRRPSNVAFVSSHRRRWRLSSSELNLYLPKNDESIPNIAPSPTQDNNNNDDDDNTVGGTAAAKIKPEFSIKPSNSLPPLHPQPPVQTLPNGGKITLVGSGPGDPNLLTLAAYKILTDPNNLIISDRLVSQEILELIQGDDVKVARKLPGCAEMAQEEIYNWCHDGLKQGKHVVRLKIGDPFVFGRGGEEVLMFRRWGVEPEVIPGVSAAFAAPLLGSIPVTHRGVSNQVVLCTGYGRNGTSPDLIQYHKEQTIVFLMAVGRLQELCTKLITMANYPSKTPVAIVERAGCPNQRTVVGTMENIAELALEYDVKPPSTIVVGEVVRVLLDQEEGGQGSEEKGKERTAVMGLIQNATASAELV